MEIAWITAVLGVASAIYGAKKAKKEQKKAAEEAEKQRQHEAALAKQAEDAELQKAIAAREARAASTSGGILTGGSGGSGFPTQGLLFAGIGVAVLMVVLLIRR